MTTPSNLPDVEVLVVGAGFSGIGTGIKLREAGIEDFLIVEDGDGVGGTWHWNTYPGIAVDIPSFSYQFSFAQRSTWSRSYAKGAELKQYAEELVDEYDLRRHLRFNTRVDATVWDESADLYRVSFADGSGISARFVISAAGVLTQPKYPDIPGVEKFGGATLHTARWDHSVDLAGKRVAIIGTGASAIQVIPEIAPEVAELTVFQRTPIWCMPKPDIALPPLAGQALRLPGALGLTRLASQAFVELTFPFAAHYYKYLPLTSRLEGWVSSWIRSQVKDPETAAKLTPNYGLGCKRPSFHNTYLATYNRDNVHLETNPIKAITKTGVRTEDGVLHQVDVLILATGFKVMERDNLPSFRVVGVDGQSTVDYFTENRLNAYEGVSIPGFPNFFLVFGPYGYNGNSYFALIETQVHHIVRMLKHVRGNGGSRVEVKAEANDRFFASMMRKRHRQIFWQESCTRANSYYFDENGDVPLRPTTTAESIWASRRYPLEDYAVSGGRAS